MLSSTPKLVIIVLHFSTKNYQLITSLHYFLLGYWYRARLISKIGEYIAAVLFVDYGDCHVVPIFRVQKLHQYFENIPFMTVPCKLSIVHLDFWSQRSIDFFLNICRTPNLCKAVFCNYKSNDAFMQVESLFVVDINVLEVVVNMNSTNHLPITG